MSVNVSWNIPKLDMLKRDFKVGVLTMAFDISNRAKDNSPVLTGNLKSSIRVIDDDNNDQVIVRAGGSCRGKLIDYAEEREFHNHKHPSKIHYMQRALVSTTTGNYIKKYFGDLGK